MTNPSAKILILDTDPPFSQQFAHALEACGHSTAVFHLGNPGLLHAISEKCDLIFLNIELSQKSGLEVLQALRKSCSTPVVVMDDGGEDRTSIRIEAFRQGADDYWTKPFHFIEAQLRVAAILRRVTCNQDPLSTDTLQVGPLHLNRRNLTARVNHQEVELTQVQFKLLWHLANHHKQILPKAYLHTLVLEKPYCQHDRSIDMHLSRVRKKLADVGLNADRVRTVHGRGYCFA